MFRTNPENDNTLPYQRKNLKWVVSVLYSVFKESTNSILSFFYETCNTVSNVYQRFS